MSYKMQVIINQVNEQTAVISLSGDITTVSKGPITQAYDQVTEANTRNIIFNFDRDHYIDSFGLSILIQLIGVALKKEQRLSISLPSAHSRKIFQLLGINHYAEIYHTLDEALNRAEVMN